MFLTTCVLIQSADFRKSAATRFPVAIYFLIGVLLGFKNGGNYTTSLPARDVVNDFLAGYFK